MKRFYIKMLLVSLMFLSGFFSYSQAIVLGTVRDSLNKPLGNVIVSVVETKTEAIIAYSTTDDEGKYEIEVEESGNFMLIFRAMSYKEVVFPIESSSNQKIIRNAIMKTELLELNEVIVHTEKPITIKKDTLIFDAKSFAQGNETVIEDLLKKIPGLNVDENGTIKVGNKEVEKVMVEGDDFFEKGYKVLTKNMNANVIDKVEIYQRYSNNRLLKSIEHSDKVALNLTLKDDIKLEWFGNMSLGYGIVSENRYELRTNLMSFGKKSKYYFLGNLNNNSSDATGELNDLLYSYRAPDEMGSIGENERANTLLSLGASTPPLKDKRINFNNSELASLNTIFTLAPSIKLKTLTFFNGDENDFYNNGFQSFTLNDIAFTNNSENTVRKKRITGLGKIDLVYDISKTKILEYHGKFTAENKTGRSLLLFNEQLTNERIKEKSQLVDQKISYSNKFNDKKVFALSGRFINEQKPQQYQNNVFLFHDLFPEHSAANGVFQESENSMQFLGFNAHLMNRKENGSIWELKSGFEQKQNQLDTKLYFIKENQAELANNDFVNKVNYNVKDAYMLAKYRLQKGNLSITGNIEAHQLWNTLKTTKQNSQQTPFFINPKLDFDWEINSNHKLFSNLSYTTTNAGVLDVYDSYLLTGFRNFEKGIASFNLLDETSTVLGYSIGNWGTKYFGNFSIIYSKNHDFLSSNMDIQPNYSLSEKIIIKDREMIGAGTSVDRFFKTIKTNLKLKFMYSQSNYKNIANNVLREIEAENYNYGIEIKSAFKGLFNYSLGTSWATTKIEATITQDNKNNISYLDFVFNIDKRWYIYIQSERYVFGNLNKDNNTYYFSDVEISYNVSDNKLKFTLTGQNLINTTTFQDYQISDVSVSSTSFRLVPRYVLLKMDFRF